MSRYRLERRLGEGALGEVFLAYDLDSLEQVALKILRGSAADCPEISRWIADELPHLVQLQHPAILQVRHIGQFGPRPALQMQYVPASSLARLLYTLEESGGRVPTVAALQLTARLADAIAAAHRCSRIHRDLRAENVLVTQAGDVKLLEFGLRRGLVSAWTTRGPCPVAPYRAPELSDPAAAEDTASDVFALCCILVECLCLRPPPPAPTGHDEHAEWLESRLSSIAGRGDGVVALLRAGLAHDATERPAASPLADALRALAPEAAPLTHFTAQWSPRVDALLGPAGHPLEPAQIEIGSPLPELREPKRESDNLHDVMPLTRFLAHPELLHELSLADVAHTLHAWQTGRGRSVSLFVFLTSVGLILTLFLAAAWLLWSMLLP